MTDINSSYKYFSRNIQRNFVYLFKMIRKNNIKFLLVIRSFVFFWFCFCLQTKFFSLNCLFSIVGILLFISSSVMQFKDVIRNTLKSVSKEIFGLFNSNIYQLNVDVFCSKLTHAPSNLKKNNNNNHTNPHQIHTTKSCRWCFPHRITLLVNQ